MAEWCDVISHHYSEVDYFLVTAYFKVFYSSCTTVTTIFNFLFADLHNKVKFLV